MEVRIRILRKLTLFLFRPPQTLLIHLTHFSPVSAQSPIILLNMANHAAITNQLWLESENSSTWDAWTGWCLRAYQSHILSMTDLYFSSISRLNRQPSRESEYSLMTFYFWKQDLLFIYLCRFVNCLSAYEFVLKIQHPTGFPSNSVTSRMLIILT